MLMDVTDARLRSRKVGNDSTLGSGLNEPSDSPWRRY
jgi:hypothetical protein